MRSGSLNRLFSIKYKRVVESYRYELDKCQQIKRVHSEPSEILELGYKYKKIYKVITNDYGKKRDVISQLDYCLNNYIDMLDFIFNTDINEVYRLLLFVTDRREKLSLVRVKFGNIYDYSQLRCYKNDKDIMLDKLFVKFNERNQRLEKIEKYFKRVEERVCDYFSVCFFTSCLKGVIVNDKYQDIIIKQRAEVNKFESQKRKLEVNIDGKLYSNMRKLSKDFSDIPKDFPIVYSFLQDNDSEIYKSFFERMKVLNERAEKIEVKMKNEGGKLHSDKQVNEEIKSNLQLYQDSIDMLFKNILSCKFCDKISLKIIDKIKTDTGAFRQFNEDAKKS